jgi:hypothetical protein
LVILLENMFVSMFVNLIISTKRKPEKKFGTNLLTFKNFISLKSEKEIKQKK